MNELAILHSKDIMTEGDLEVLKNSKFKGFNDAEISYARQICAHLQLNPLLNQIHFVKRKHNDGTYSIATQTGIDGFRLVAERTGKYAGNDEPVFEVRKEGDKYPTKATVTVYKLIEGVRCAFTASAHWEEYFPGEGSKESFMWRKMPKGQLAKCAEALALRKGFPAELSALRTDEEMAQANPDANQTKASKLNNRGTPQEIVLEADFVNVKSVELEGENAEPAQEEPMPEANSENAIPECHGKPMFISKYVDRDLGHEPFVCLTCKKKVPRL